MGEDNETTKSLGDVMAEEASEFINSEQNPFPSEDAQNQIKHNLAGGNSNKYNTETTQPQKSDPSSSISEVEDYLKNPNRPGLSNRQAAMKVQSRQLMQASLRKKDPLYSPKNIADGLKKLEDHANNQNAGS